MQTPAVSNTTSTPSRLTASDRGNSCGGSSFFFYNQQVQQHRLDVPTQPIVGCFDTDQQGQQQGCFDRPMSSALHPYRRSDDIVVEPLTTNSRIASMSLSHMWNDLWNSNNNNNGSTDERVDGHKVATASMTPPPRDQSGLPMLPPPHSGTMMDGTVDAAVAVAATGGDDNDRQLDEIAQALSSLSFNERQDAYNDIHGITNADSNRLMEVENPEYIQQCIDRLEKQLMAHLRNGSSSIDIGDDGSSSTSSAFQQPLSTQAQQAQPQRQSAFQLAMDQNQAYVKNKSFLCSFLRAEEFNIERAAARIITFFEEKRSLFGDSKLTKDITLDDMSKDDMMCIQHGGLQHVPILDQAGRHIMIHVSTLNKYKTDENFMRFMYYMIMSIMENDVQAQRLGVVELSYQVENVNSGSLNTKRKIMKLRHALPLKLAAMHVCTKDPAIRFIVKILSSVINSHTIARAKIHCGNHLEVQYDLMSYGIPVAALPIDLDGKCNNDNHRCWIQRRKEMERKRKKSTTTTTTTAKSSSTTDAVHGAQQEQLYQLAEESLFIATPNMWSYAGTTSRSTTPTSMSPVPNDDVGGGMIMEPGPNDCILGRGQPVDQHVGNIRFRKFLQEHLTTYANAPHYMKHKVGNEIQRMLEKDHKVRFLKKHESGTGWTHADNGAIREKILRTFRRMCLQNKRKGQQQKK